MKWFKVVFILSTVLRALAVAMDSFDFALAIRDLFVYLNKPVRLVAVNVCWHNDILAEFIRTITMPPGIEWTFSVGIGNTIDDIRSASATDVNAILLDLSCSGSANILREAGPLLHYESISWIVVSRSPSNLMLFGELCLLPSSEFYVLDKDTYGDRINIRQFYRHTADSRLIVDPFGSHYGNSTVQDIRVWPITSRRRRNFERNRLRATIVVTNNDTLNHLDDYRDKHIDTITKVNYILTNHLMFYLNATIQKYSVVSTWGYKDPNTGRWSGMIGQLVANESDIGASPLFFTADRIAAVEFIAMPSPTRSSFVFRSPKLSFTENIFLLPFNRYVWYSTVALIIVVAGTLAVAVGIEWRLFFPQSPGANLRNSDSNALRPSVGDAFILLYGASCQQGSAFLPRTLPPRAITFIGFMALMFLYASYSANIVALLQSPSTKIRTLNDLLNSRLKLGVDDTVFNHYYFANEQEPIRKAIYEKKLTNKKDGSVNYMTLENGVKKLREGLFAFHMELGVGFKVISETFLESEKCDLETGIQYLQVANPWYSIQKNSSYKELIKTGMMRIHEHGLQDRENSLLYTKKPRCSSTTGGNFVPVSLIDTYPAILALLWGALIAFFLLFVEIISNKCSKHTHSIG